MTSRKLLSIVFQTSFTALVLCTASLFAQTPSFVTFDAPDAGTGQSQGTIPIGITKDGAIAGYYYDSAGFTHGFLREVDGTIKEFDAMGMAGLDTLVTAINNRKQVIGNGTSQRGTTLGFRRRDTDAGTWYLVQFPGSTHTLASGINDNGFITGTYAVVSEGPFGYLYDPATGSYTTFEDPDAVAGSGTQPLAINLDGTIAGYYYKDIHTGQSRAFVRDSLGNFTNYDAAVGDKPVTVPVAINKGGEIVGYYFFSDFHNHAFTRDASGTITDFDVPGAIDTAVFALNDAGTTVGQWTNSTFTTQGFMRTSSGAITTFSVPVANKGTFPFAINNSNRVTGYYLDRNLVAHGFVR